MLFRSRPPGRVSTRPAGRGRSEGTGASRRCGRGRFFASFLCRHKKGGRPPGRDPANHRQLKAPQKPNGKGQMHWTPACAGATNRVRMPRPKRRRQTLGDDANFGSARCLQLAAMAKPSRQQPSPSAAPSAARGRRELSRRCLSPRGRVSTRPAGRGWSEGTGASRRCGRGASLSIFLVATRKMVARRGETRPITASRKTPPSKR